MSDHDPFEEKFFGRKERKQERKRASQKDRSQFKKSDRDKRNKRPKLQEQEDLLRGKVVALLPQEVVVECEKKLFSCTLKGKLKQERRQVKNLVVVGDVVLFEREGGIVAVEERKSLLSRRASHETRKEQIIASNIDQVLITVSTMHPPLFCHVIDRFIIATLKGGMVPVLVINKIDLLKERGEIAEIVALYRGLDLAVCCVSAESHLGIEELQREMEGKASLFAGESGVGKSSLISAVTGVPLETREVAHKSKKGVHTTTGARLLALPCGGWCIDSPGIQNLNLWNCERSDVIHYFPEIFEKGRACKYPDCTHSHEPDCAVLQAIEKGEVALQRYRSFRKLWEELNK